MPRLRERLAPGDDDGAAVVYELLTPHADRVLVLGEGAVCGVAVHCFSGPSPRYGVITTGRSRYFEAAARVHERLGVRPFLACDRIGLARLLVAAATISGARNWPGPASRRRREFWTQTLVDRNADLAS